MRAIQVVVLVAVTIGTAIGANRISATKSAAPATVRDPAFVSSTGTPAQASKPYSPTSPHWSHIRTMVTDFRIGYVSNVAQRNAERSWTAGHFDYVMSGDASAYKAINSTIRILPYALDWDVIQPGQEKSSALGSTYYPDMQQWFANHPQFALENAFVHVAGQPKSESTRLQFVSWGSRKWVINPGDSGARAYVVDRIRRVVQDADGVFFDSHSSGDVGTALGKQQMLEYSDRKLYEHDMVEYVRTISAAVAPKVIMINTSEYMRPFDYAMITAAGAVHLERMNNPLNSGMPERWRWADSLLAHNVTVELVPLNSWNEANTARGVFSTFTPGDYSSKGERLKMFELASYYMVVPATPDQLLLDLENSWKVPFETVWLKAQEYDVGHPRGARRALQTGRDPMGNGFTVWARDFDRALILARPSSSWRVKIFGDTTAVSVPLPNGQALRPLRGDGTLGPPVTSITLRNAEAAILIKSSADSTGA